MSQGNPSQAIAQAVGRSESRTIVLNRFWSTEYVGVHLVSLYSPEIFWGKCEVPTHVELNRRSKHRWRSRVRVLERAERLGLISEMELQSRLTALNAPATGLA